MLNAQLLSHPGEDAKFCVPTFCVRPIPGGRRRFLGLVDKLKAWESVSLPFHALRLSHCPDVAERQW